MSLVFFFSQRTPPLLLIIWRSWELCLSKEAGHLSCSYWTLGLFSTISCLCKVNVFVIFSLIVNALFLFFTSFKSASHTTSRFADVSPAGRDGIWLASPRLGRVTFFAGKAWSEALIFFLTCLRILEKRNLIRLHTEEIINKCQIFICLLHLVHFS